MIYISYKLSIQWSTKIDLVGKELTLLQYHEFNSCSQREDFRMISKYLCYHSSLNIRVCKDFGESHSSTLTKFLLKKTFNPMIFFLVYHDIETKFLLPFNID